MQIQAEPEGSALIESRVKLLLEMHNKKVESRITELKDAIAALAAELQNAKSQLSRFQETKAGKVVQVVKETQKSLEKKEPESHPKRGQYEPGDIQIDKVFYFGNR